MKRLVPRHRLAARVIAAVAVLVPWFVLARTAAGDHVRHLLDIGAYAEAEREATTLMAQTDVEDSSASDPQIRVLSTLVEARVANGKAGDARTLELAERAVRLAERSTGLPSSTVADALHNLGSVHLERGEFSVALTIHQRALSINDTDVASSLEQVARAEILLERFTSARQRLQRVIAIRESRIESSPFALARVLELQAMLHRYSGEYAQGLAVLERIAAIRGRVAPERPYTPSLLSMRGDLLFLAGDIAGAREAWSSGLAAAEDLLDPQHPAIVQFLRELALAADAFGNRAESRVLLDRAVTLGRARLPPCHPEVAGLLNDQAQSKERDGDFAAAKALYRQQVNTLQRCYDNANWTATALHNSANLAAEMGDLAEAERLHAQAIQVWSARLGPRHPYVARGIDALADVVAQRGELARARQLYERALAIRRGHGDSSQPDVAWTMTNLARTVGDLGNETLALRYVRRAIAIYQKAGASDEPDHLARALELQGMLQARHGDLAAAHASLTAALAERERIFGAAHPLVAASRAALAHVQLLEGAKAEALAGSLAAESVGRDHLRFTVRYLPERQAMSYAAKRPGGLDLALSIAAADPSSASHDVFDAVIRSRGLILDELAHRARLVNTRDADPQTSELAASAIQARQRYANLVVRSLREPVSRNLLDEARQQAEEAEGRLAERSADARAEAANAQVGLDEVRQALPPGSVLLSFVKYDRTSARSNGFTWSRPIPAYGTFVQRAGNDRVEFIPLGDAGPLEALVKAWHDQAAGHAITSDISARDAERQYRATATRLRRTIWDPVASSLAGAARILIVPDGLLNIVNFAALPDRDGRYLVEHEPIMHYFSTERDVTTPSSSTPSRGLLVVGAPAFDAPKSDARRLARAATRGSACKDFGQVRFGDLPGARQEIAEIAQVWPVGDVSDVKALSGLAATETAVKRAAVGRRVVHLATHGFFLGGTCAASPAGTRGVGGLAPRSSTRPSPAPAATTTRNPLQLAGLALVGANQVHASATEKDDGILTAEEIAGLNLQGTEWAVLSACDTGLGEIKTGEGVFGLRRAFQIAGVHTVIMSLWAVEDQSARVWMRALYDSRFNKRLKTADAVREASLRALHERQSRRLSTHPFYWAGFVAVGDWH